MKGRFWLKTPTVVVVLAAGIVVMHEHHQARAVARLGRILLPR
jgi:hypothetical protein